MQFCMLNEPDHDDPFDCLRQECQIGNLVDIGVHIFRIEIRLFQPWAKIMVFNMFGKLPSPIDMLHIFVIVPARSGTSRLMIQVGAGSSMQCFAGDAPTIFKISSAVTGRKPDRAGNCLSSITGGLALDVDRRILLTLFWKRSANSSGENLQSDDALG